MMTTEDKILLGQAINIVSADNTHNDCNICGDDWKSQIKSTFYALRAIKIEVQEELANEK